MSKFNSKGYLSEVFTSIQGEGGTVRGSCFGKRQIFIRFSGCNLAGGAFNSSGCFWCDSPLSQKFEIKNFNYEETPGSLKLKSCENPVEISEIFKIIKNLITPDLHSISFTGGEPLCQFDFILNLIKTLKKKNFNYPSYLETNGTVLPGEEKLKELSKFFKFCCCDIKDRSSKAASSEKWENLVKIELKFIEKIMQYGVEVFAKIVVTSHTQIQDIRWISKNLSKIRDNNGEMVGLAIQPVILEEKELKDKYTISTAHLNEIFYSAAKYLKPDNLTLSIQAHKFLKLL